MDAAVKPRGWVTAILNYGLLAVYRRLWLRNETQQNSLDASLTVGFFYRFTR